VAKRDRDNTFEVEIEGMAHGGSGIGRHHRRTVFVPFTIPGERVLVRPVSEQEHYIHAEGVRLLEASADRVYPACEAFGSNGCVRCHWQHIAYEAQLLLKQDVLADQLERIGKVRQVDIRPTVPSPLEWGYHYHMTFVVTPDGRLALPGRDAKRVVTVHECQLLHPELLELYDTLDLELEGISRVRLQIGSDGVKMLILTVTEDTAPELEADFPASVNLLLPSNEPVNLIGDAHSRYDVGSRSFRVTAGSYIRPNIPQLTNLAGAVETLLDAKPDDHVLDLYAGVGIFSAVLAARAARVTLVESYPPAVTDADENLSGFDNVDVFEGGVDNVLESLDEPYDAAVIDPPSGGVSGKIVTQLARLGVKRLIYVSDDPGTLARDTRRLAQAGFRLVAAQPIDLSPQTYYLDSVALFINT
jgi:23S rRNA (uracil1939-C5)-methyltransferase